MVRTLIDDVWVREIHKEGLTEYTFCGALEYRYKHIAKNWNTETRRKHEREYSNIILPALKNHNDKSIREYTRDDFEEAIECIKENGYERDGVKRQYAETSIYNFENLIYYVVYQSAVYGLCDNVLWGTKFVLDVPNETEEIEEKVILKKSLSIEQEKCFSNEVIMDPAEDGAMVALLLMWGLGLRNAEACGLNYGDIRTIEGHPECYAAWVYKSTKIKSNELQSGGKTYNTGRIVPVPDKIVRFLNARKALLQKVVDEQEKTDVNINELPICCNGWLEIDCENYTERCKADKISITAHDIFERAGITSKQLAFLDAKLSEGNTASLLKEKEPTAYLLRRNFATQMCILGLSNSEMQYLMGHDVEDAYESRNEYVDSERIYSMHLKLQQRELLNEKNDDYNKAEICVHSKEVVKIHISAKEPTDGIRIQIAESGVSASVKTRRFEGTEAFTGDRTVNVLEYYHMRYNQ
ncbi:MAG: site-specific integrase [Lachnospiraceae bacterium]